jgi:hypothetical protein
VKRIAQLRSTADGSATATPQALLNDVAQEAQDVLMQSQQGKAALPLELGQVTSGNSPVQEQPMTWGFKALASQLLWDIARSTHEVVRLIEGVTAQVHQDGQIWQRGILRLIVALELKPAAIATTAATDGLDLVTFQAATSALPEGQIQIQESLLGQQPLTAAHLLQQLTPQIVAAAPTLSRFLAGFAADWLVPHQDWQTGSLKLKFGFEFMPFAAVPLHREPDDACSALIKFTQPTWLEQHITHVVEHQLTQVLWQLAPVSSHLPVPEALIEIVRQGCMAIDGLQCSLALASRTFAQQTLSLEDLALRLLWGINRTAYRVMQLTSGIRVKLLQPRQGWTVGSLRFVLQLTIRTPEQDQQFDLARRSLGCNFSPLDPAAIVQTCEGGTCEDGTCEDGGWAEPMGLSQLEAILWQHIDQGAPEIALLRSGSEITVMDSDDQALGVVQLEAAFEFTPDFK